MAQIAGTTDTYDVGAAGGNFEDLADVIHDLFPDENFLQANLAAETCSAVNPEWMAQELAAPGTNAVLEGDDAPFSDAPQPSRYGNYTQILRKTFLISGTQEAVDSAGRRSEIARQATKQMREIMNDFEWALVRNQAAVAGASGTPRQMASIETWIGGTPSATAAGNVVRTTGSTGGTFTEVTSGFPTTAITDAGSPSAFTQAAAELALEGAWDEGGNTDTILCSASVKNVVNGFTGIAQRQVDVGRTEQASITAAADLFVSNYGTHRVVLHRHARNNVCLFLDTSMWSIKTLRDWSLEELAKTGDGEKRMITAEKTLCAHNWRANSKVVGIDPAA
ncbi:MAG: DUF5309 family protein [Pseudomonadota bacterium]